MLKSPITAIHLAQERAARRIHTMSRLQLTRAAPNACATEILACGNLNLRFFSRPQGLQNKSVQGSSYGTSLNFAKSIKSRCKMPCLMANESFLRLSGDLFLRKYVYIFPCQTDTERMQMGVLIAVDRTPNLSRLNCTRLHADQV